MPITYERISTLTVATTTATDITFTSIPSTFDDLFIEVSARLATSTEINLRFNGSSSNLSDRVLYGIGGVGLGTNTSSTIRIAAPDSTALASAFNSVGIFIPSYRSSNDKLVSIDSFNENNSTSSYSIYITSGRWANSAAITSITLVPSSGNIVQNSEASLYGVKRT